MPDLKSELAKVINAWETPEKPPVGAPGRQATTGTSRATFDYIKAHPGQSLKQIRAALALAGHKATTVSTLLLGMRHQGIVRGDPSGLYVAQDEYTPIKPKVVRAAQKARKATKVPRPVRQVAPVAKVVAPAEFNAEDFVNGLTLKQAKDVYVKLQEFFG